MLRMNDNSHEQFGEADARRDGGVRDHESARDLVGRGTRFGLRADRAGAEGAPISPAEQRATRDRETFPGEGHRLEPSPTDAPDPALDGYAADRTKTGAAPELPAALHRCRYRGAGRVGCGPRRSLGAGGPALVPASLEGIWRREVPTAGGDLGVAHLQPARGRRPTERSGCGSSTPRRARYRSGSGAVRNRKGGRVICGWTPCTKGSTTAKSGCITSTPWTR